MENDNFGLRDLFTLANDVLSRVLDGKSVLETLLHLQLLKEHYCLLVMRMLRVRCGTLSTATILTETLLCRVT